MHSIGTRAAAAGIVSRSAIAMPGFAPGFPRPKRVGNSRPSVTSALTASPDLTEVLSHHRIAGLAAEGLRELRERGRRARRAELRQRVRIRVQHQLRELGPDVRRPDVRPREEETLVVGQAVDLRRRGLPLAGHVVRAVRDPEAAEIGRRLAEDELAVDVLALVLVRGVLVLD